MTATDSKLRALRQRLLGPVDAASLAVFRIGFGALMLVAVLRFFAHGWIAEYFLQPKHFFKYWGFEWVEPWPGPFMYVHFAAMALCALGILLGYRYRLSVVGFGALFAYAHLIDKTNYLNHYYLVVCLCGLLALLPLHCCWSLDARRRPELASAQLPAWMLWALRAQLSVVYLFGGIAKLKPDWLLRAEPLSIWLGRHTDLPLFGALFAQPWAAYVMSWAGAAFDLSVVPLLLVRRTRHFAYLGVLTFHLMTARLFQLGMFPYIMMFGSLLFLAADWPRVLGRRLGLARWVTVGVSATPAARPWVWAALTLYFAVQLLLPFRHWLYPGSVCWTEQGYRFSWNVMLMEKNGSVDFRVVEPSTGRTFAVSPLQYFTPYQTKMMAPQPDMVLQAAHIVAADFRARGVRAPAVYADAFASLNGRPMQRLIDARANLAAAPDDLSNKPWILPMKTNPEGNAALAWSPK
jgi:vitamin K-dependent gamma-carboxylase